MVNVGRWVRASTSARHAHPVHDGLALSLSNARGVVWESWGLALRGIPPADIQFTVNAFFQAYAPDVVDLTDVSGIFFSKIPIFH
jgi:hypothetical protein